MRYLFLLNPAAGKQDCTVQLIPQIRAAAARAGWSEADYAIHTTEYAGHARELARAAAQKAAQAGGNLRIWTAGGDGTFMEAMTGVQGFASSVSWPFTKCRPLLYIPSSLAMVNRPTLRTIITSSQPSAGSASGAARKPPP